MVDHSTSDSAYTRGRIEGYLHAVARYTDQDTTFDQDRWQERYGNRVIYESFPAGPSEGARESDEDQIVLCDWKDATETLYLKDGVDIPLDRSGAMVFEDGTVAMVTSGIPYMFSVDSEEVDRIEQLAELSLKMLREAHDYTPS